MGVNSPTLGPSKAWNQGLTLLHWNLKRLTMSQILQVTHSQMICSTIRPTRHAPMQYHPWAQARPCYPFERIEMKLDLWVAVLRAPTARASNATDALGAEARLSQAARYLCDVQHVQGSTTEDVILMLQYRLISLRLITGLAHLVSKRPWLANNFPRRMFRSPFPNPRRRSSQQVLPSRTLLTQPKSCGTMIMIRP